MAKIKDRPRVTYDPGDDMHPFLHTSGEGKVLEWLTRSTARHLLQDLEAAFQEDMERRACVGNRHHPGVQVDTLPSGELVVRCRHCPCEFVTAADGCVVPVGVAP